MLKIFCDCCGEDAGNCAFDVRVNLLHNPIPKFHFDEFGEPKITDYNARVRFTLCERCYRQMGFPNLYKAIEDTKLTFRLEQEKVQKRWKRVHGAGESDKVRECPHCGVTQTINVYHDGRAAYKFCPICGGPTCDGEPELQEEKA